MVEVTWRGSPNHYPGRYGHTVTAIADHIMSGYLWGTDACFQQASFQASSHYGVGPDLILQWVSETDGAWANANTVSDCSTISIEHQGGLDGIPVTESEIELSARLHADIARRYGWPRLVHGENVVLHREIPPYAHPACPDLCPNPLPWERIIDRANQILANQTTEQEDIMQAIIQLNDEPGLNYFDGQSLHPLTHPDQVDALQQVAKACGRELPMFKLGSKAAPYGTRLREALGQAKTKQS